MSRRWALWLVFGLSFVAAGALYAAMATLTLPALLAGPEALRPFDVRPLGYDAAEARAYLAALSQQGRATYLGLQQRLDFWFPAANALWMGAAVLLLFGGRVRFVLLAVILAATLGDYSENAAVAALLTADPGTLSDATIATANRFTLIKSLGTSLVWLALLGGLFMAWRRRK
ncbi:hypothetical protein [Pseudooceanicola sp.]|uniref:hypothetical protein n=1 Tax=Pseudooceanicola sp. TaxID=1914328 RepID=UPI002626603A|nr:hypothetical protein [Pseudooceanicola sp.]MDF1855986.1 hypothetical protein [Pseudooceanicola sp.]